MGQLTELASTLGAPTVVNGFIAVSIKAAAVLTGALALTTALRRAPASTRHQVWAMALLAVLVLPVLSLTLPAWQVAVLPQPLDPASPVATPAPPAPMAEPGAAPGVDSYPDAQRIAERDDNGPARQAETTPAVSPSPGAAGAGEADGASLVATTRSAHARAERTDTQAARRFLPEAPLSSFLLALWAVGFAYLLGRLGVSTLGAWWLVRRADPVADESLMDEAEAVRRDLGVTAGVRLLHSDRISMPMAWGVLRPTILLPREALDWDHDRSRVVLLHEMAHLQRRDCLTLMLARLVTALHWFNPLSWTATRRLQAERERACDDLVLSSGTAGADYAQHLLDIARGVRRDRIRSWATVAMARPSELEGRLLAILDPDRQPSGASGAIGVAALLALGVLVLPLAALQPSAVAQQLADDEEAVEQDIDVTPQQALELETSTRPLLDLDALPAVALELALPQTLEIGVDVPAARGLAVALSEALAEEVELGTQEPQSADEQGTAVNERVLQAFAAALQDEDASIRAQAAQALGSMESEAAVEMLSAALRDDDDARVRSQAAWALGMIESAAAVPVLSEVLASDEDRVRKQAVWALGMIESSDAVQPLAAALSDEDAGIRSKAAWALGMIESPDAVAALVDALGDAEARVRSQAVWALGMIEDAGGVEALTATLRGDDSPEVRKQAAWALGMIEDEGGLDALLDAMTDDNLEVRKTALWAVGQIGG